MATNLLRLAAVAGRFYPADEKKLRAEVDAYLTKPLERNPIPALGCVVPHAGYMYSGRVAGAVFSRIEIPELCLVLCPNHTGMGRPLAIMSEGAWKTPLGDVAIDQDFAAQLKRRCPLLEEDSAAHLREHAIEVELPFLQMRQPRLRFVPIALGTRQFDVLEALAAAIAETVQRYEHRVLIVASSDMNHYEPDATTRIKDSKAIEPILALEPRGLYGVVMEEQISMCGLGPTVAMLIAAKQLGAKSVELVKYATSGETSGDFDHVVGYAGVVIS